jgi:glyoxylase-like metal-dependent hydrolase (beta-lactamase superfamily II)
MIRRHLALFGSGLVLASALLQACMSPATSTGRTSGVQRLYILNCGEGVAGDISRWSPGVNVGKSMEFADNCYLVRHSQGWLLWDTGVPDSVAKLPDGLRPADPRATHWRRPRTLTDQLTEIGVSPASIGYVAISHSHPDHTGNLALFPNAMLLVQKAEYDWPDASGPRFARELKVTKLEGDQDLFGDGTVVLLATPGHTPGHQSLLVKLPHTGAVLLSGDAVHFRENWEARRVPDINFDKARTSASMERLAEVIAKERAALWINHDKAQRDTLRMSPAFYD